MTLVPTSPERTPLTPDRVYDLLFGLRTDDDHIEHIRVIEQAGRLRIGAYFSVAESEQAQVCLDQLCQRLVRTVSGWECLPGA